MSALPISAAHTPGPWRYWRQRRPGGEDTCTFRAESGAEILRAVTVTLTQADANLIVAAPELFESANAALDALTDERADAQFKTDAARMLRAAIAKAVTQ